MVSGPEEAASLDQLDGVTLNSVSKIQNRPPYTLPLNPKPSPTPHTSDPKPHTSNATGGAAAGERVPRVWCVGWKVLGVGRKVEGGG